MVSTYFAPPERADQTALCAARAAYLENHFAVTLLNAITDFAVVINTQRQIIAANDAFLRALNVTDINLLMGLRPGEAVDCAFVQDGPAGCGTGRYCIHCGGVDAIVECLRTEKAVTRECRIVTNGATDGGALELEVTATFLKVSAHGLAILVMRDISAEKRRRLLEQVFFHDVLNTASGVHMVVQLMEEEEEPHTQAEYVHTLSRLAKQLIDEISSQQQLLAAEEGGLRVNLVDVAVADILQEVQTSYHHHELTKQCRLKIGAIPSCRIITDVVILNRVLGNLVKNAVEASAIGGTVTITAQEDETTVAFSVHNRGVMPEAVQRQIFQRSFSTKSQRGRGIGTYSVKLFTERYLGGQVSFVSEAPLGTIFTLTFPKHHAPA